MIYFDHNATTPLLPEARQAWLDATERYPGNPSSPHRLGARAEAALHQAREKLAGWLGCDGPDIVWTSGATESNNMVLHHLAWTQPAGAEVWVSAIEHPCVLDAVRRYFPRRHRLIPVTRSGVTDLDWIERRLGRGRPALVAVMAANNETGVLQPWREALALCREQGVPFWCDAAQWLGKLASDGLGECDFLSGCAHKFGGPKGVGFLKCAGRGRFHPLLVGGGQEMGRRPGTENVAGVLAMVAALEACERLRFDNSQRLEWRRAFEKRLEQQLTGVEIVGRSQERLWNTVSALMPSAADCRQRWVVKLDKVGLAVSTGSACASGKEKSSHVLAAMGYGLEQTDRVLRFSSGWGTIETDWLGLAKALVKVHREMGPGDGTAQGGRKRKRVTP